MRKRLLLLFYSIAVLAAGYGLSAILGKPATPGKTDAPAPTLSNSSPASKYGSLPDLPPGWEYVFDANGLVRRPCSGSLLNLDGCGEPLTRYTGKIDLTKKKDTQSSSSSEYVRDYEYIYDNMGQLVIDCDSFGCEPRKRYKGPSYEDWKRQQDSIKAAAQKRKWIENIEQYNGERVTRYYNDGEIEQDMQSYSNFVNVRFRHPDVTLLDKEPAILIGKDKERAVDFSNPGIALILAKTYFDILAYPEKLNERRYSVSTVRRVLKDGTEQHFWLAIWNKPFPGTSAYKKYDKKLRKVPDVCVFSKESGRLVAAWEAGIR
jgi:hypothetical protein